MDPPSSSKISRVPLYLFVYLVPQRNFCVRGYHPLWQSFPTFFTNFFAKIYQAIPRSLATTQGISVDFFSYGYLDVSVPHVRHVSLRPTLAHKVRRVSPFGHLRITAYLPTPRSFSQATTSFFASDCQGIHRLRLFSWLLGRDRKSTSELQSHLNLVCRLLLEKKKKKKKHTLT